MCDTFGCLYRKYVKSFYWSVLTLMTIGETPSPQTNLVSECNLGPLCQASKLNRVMNHLTLCLITLA